MMVGVLVKDIISSCISSSGRSLIFSPSCPLLFPSVSGRSPEKAIRDMLVLPLGLA